MGNYTIVKLNKANINCLYILYKAVYSKKQSMHYYEKKYALTILNEGAVGFFMLDKNDPIAFFGIIPTRLSIQSNIILAGQMVDLMVLPKYRFQGLYTELVLYAMDSLKNTSISLLYVFPNQNSFPGLIQKLNFTHLETMNCYTFNTQHSFIKKIKTKLLNFNNEPKVINFKNSLLEYGYDAVIYDKEYLEYKAYNPNYFIKDNDDTLWLNKSNITWLGAINVSDKKTTFYNAIKTMQESKKLTTLTYLVSPNNPIDDSLSLVLKPTPAFPIVIKQLGKNHDLNKLKFQFSDVDIF
jgi:N-acetylglutamate synthase-like GNAT family acetyltransferase